MGLFLFCTFLVIALAIFACRACHSSGTLFSFWHTHTRARTTKWLENCSYFVTERLIEVNIFLYLAILAVVKKRPLIESFWVFVVELQKFHSATEVEDRRGLEQTKTKAEVSFNQLPKEIKDSSVFAKRSMSTHTNSLGTMLAAGVPGRHEHSFTVFLLFVIMVDTSSSHVGTSCCVTAKTKPCLGMSRVREPRLLDVLCHQYVTLLFTACVKYCYRFTKIELLPSLLRQLLPCFVFIRILNTKQNYFISKALLFHQACSCTWSDNATRDTNWLEIYRQNGDRETAKIRTINCNENLCI